MMQVATHPVRSSLNRQINHWLQAASRLSALEHLASGSAWQGIDHKLGIVLRETLQKSVQQVLGNAESLKRQFTSVQDDEGLRAVKRGLMDLRNQYLKAEETIHFYTVAINSRTTANVAALLRACD